MCFKVIKPLTVRDVELKTGDRLEPGSVFRQEDISVPNLCYLITNGFVARVRERPVDPAPPRKTRELKASGLKKK